MWGKTHEEAVRLAHRVLGDVCVCVRVCVCVKVDLLRSAGERVTLMVAKLVDKEGGS